MKQHGIGVGYRYPHDFEGADVEHVVALGEVAVDGTGVWMVPGQQRVDPVRRAARSRPASAGSATRTAPFEAAYDARRARPTSAIVEDMLMIEPRPAAIIVGSTARATRKTPRTFTAITRSHSSTEVSAGARRRRSRRC